MRPPRSRTELGLTGDEATGVEVVAKPRAPVYWIAANAGREGAVVADKVATGVGQGFNALTGATADLLADGVVDPVKVTRPRWSTPRRSRDVADYRERRCRHAGAGGAGPDGHGHGHP